MVEDHALEPPYLLVNFILDEIFQHVIVGIEPILSIFPRNIISKIVDVSHFI